MRHYRYKIVFLLIALPAFCKPLRAQLRLPWVLGSNMVLQCNKPIPVWGDAGAGQEVTVQFHGQQKKTVADASGKWKLGLEPLSATATPADMIIATKDTLIRLQNILIGEVWL